MMVPPIRLTLFLVLAITSNQCAGAIQVFFDDFEDDDLSSWVGKDGGNHSGEIVLDPLAPSNHVLTFSGLSSAGDVFSRKIEIIRGLQYVLEFDYLGIPGSGVPGDLGGFIGIAEATPGAHRWLDSTSSPGSGSENDSFIDDGIWRTYTVTFDPFDENRPALLNNGLPLNPSDSTIRIMLEDFSYSQGVAGDVFFDNIRLSASEVPEPNSALIWISALLFVIGSRLRKWQDRVPTLPFGAV